MTMTRFCVMLAAPACACALAVGISSSKSPAGPSDRYERHLDDEREEFRIERLRALANGLEITFSEPLAPRIGWDVDDYMLLIQLTGNADETAPATAVAAREIEIRSASVAEDRRSVFLETDHLSRGDDLHIRLARPIESEDGSLPQHTEIVFPLNEIHEDTRGVVRPAPFSRTPNTLTSQQRRDGWRLLFDGQTTDGWRGFRRSDMPDGWQVVDGTLNRVAQAGDIITEEQFENFELILEWKISPRGNSGIFWRVSEDFGAVWLSGPEMQILDNDGHRDGLDPRTSAGSDYALYAPPRDVTRPVGKFNRAHIVVDGRNVTYYLNGIKVVEYELFSEDWERRVAASKFRDMPQFGRIPKGHIALQDHGDPVWFRSIMIRELPSSDAGDVGDRGDG